MKRTKWISTRSYRRFPALAQVVVMSISFLLAVTCCITFPPLNAAAAAAAAEPSAQEILDSISSSNILSGNGQATLEMTVVSKQGRKKVQQLELYRRDDGKGNVSQLLVFTAPADIKGTKFLSIGTAGKETQMWLYMPTLGRERLISGSATQGQFMGTDFTYEEISGAISFSAEYTAKRLADTTKDKLSCYVLELTPKSDKAKYGRLKLVVHKESRIPLVIEFFNRAGKAEKTLTLDGLHKSKDGIWQPKTIILNNLSSGSSTIIDILQESREEVSEEMFTLRYLRR